MPPVVFLDIDGVLNSAVVRRDPPLDPRAIDVLNRIVAASGAVLVISSTWRIGRDLLELARMLGQAGVLGRVVGKTPELPGQERWQEIAAWLAANPSSRFVILDDQPHMGELAGAHLRTRSFTGLQEGDLAAALAILAVA